MFLLLLLLAIGNEHIMMSAISNFHGLPSVLLLVCQASCAHLWQLYQHSHSSAQKIIRNN